jgi:hypothetical protein
MNNWSNIFTGEIRAERPTYWGNWSLTSFIKPGAVGYLDPSSGEFTPLIESIPGAEISENIYSQEWNIQSSSVSSTTIDLDANGSIANPEVGISGEANIATTIHFGEQGSISSTFVVSKESMLKNSINFIRNNMEWLKNQVNCNHQIPIKNLAQGICVVTNVTYASSGMNLGATQKDSDFKVSGQASAVKAMTGLSVGVKGSYAQTDSNKSMSQHLWPSTPGTIANEDVPIAFTVTSFDDEVIIPNWSRMIQSLDLTLDNTNGGTYIAHGLLTYDYKGEHITSKNTASGGMRSAISDIPPGATNLKYVVTFTASGARFVFNWDCPVMQWSKTGAKNIKIKGVWPGKPKATEE